MYLFLRYGKETAPGGLGRGRLEKQLKMTKSLSDFAGFIIRALSMLALGRIVFVVSHAQSNSTFVNFALTLCWLLPSIIGTVLIVGAFATATRAMCWGVRRTWVVVIVAMNFAIFVTLAYGLIQVDGILLDEELTQHVRKLFHS